MKLLTFILFMNGDYPDVALRQKVMKALEDVKTEEDLRQIIDESGNVKLCEETLGLFKKLAQAREEKGGS